MNHGSGIFWDIFNAARLLSKCLGRAVRAQAGRLLAAVSQLGGPRGISFSPWCCHPAATHWRGDKGRDICPHALGNNSGCDGWGEKGGPEAASSSLKGRQEGRKFPHHLPWKVERAGERQSWGMGERVGISACRAAVGREPLDLDRDRYPGTLWVGHREQ